MSNPTGPVSMTVRIVERVDATKSISFSSEFVVTSEEEAREKGAQFYALELAWLNGFSEAAE